MGLLFIGLTKSPADVVEAAVMVPASEVAAYIYFTLFAVLILKYRLIPSLLIALLSWALSAFLLLTFPPANFLMSILYMIPGTFITYLIIISLPQVHHLKVFPMNAKHILTRSILGGTMITLSVILSKTLGNIWGGLFSTFPATFTSTMIIYYLLQGKQVIPSVGKSLFFPGLFGYMIYAYIVALTYPRFGIWLGTVLSYTAIAIFFVIWNLIAKHYAKPMSQVPE